MKLPFKKAVVSSRSSETVEEQEGRQELKILSLQERKRKLAENEEEFFTHFFLSS